MPLGMQPSVSCVEASFMLTVYRAGELFDLEALSSVCAETGRYSFFFASWPLNMYVPEPKLLDCKLITDIVVKPGRVR